MMPTYEYKCNNCNYVFEMTQKMSDEPIKICPKCGKDIKRLIGSGAGTIFKGSGFYHTDYKNKPAANPGKKNSSEDKKNNSEDKPVVKKDSDKEGKKKT